MNNHQPLNLITSANGGGSDRPPSMPSLQSQLSGEERQMALASLFSSLSSLASVVGQQQQQHHHQQHESHHILQQQQQQQQQTATAFLSDQCNLFSPNLQQQQQHHQQQQQQQPQPPQQRINYCTICNKELCNKYFMKTHMLKMHGINLEMEPPDADEQEKNDDEQDEGDNATAGDGDEVVDAEERESENSSSSQPWPAGAKKRSTPPTVGGGSQKRPASTSHKSATSPANKKHQSASSAGATQKATSVVNGFAGNSMGGVVCDICNKELCSKYFLKVHKQNTHGIQTDYQDQASQFMYAPFAAPNPFISAPAAQSAFSPSPLSSLFASAVAQSSPAAAPLSHGGGQPMASAAKRLRLGQQQPGKGCQLGKTGVDIEKVGNEVGATQVTDSSNGANGGGVESVYRLLLAQQQQQHHHHHQLQLQAATAPVVTPALMPLDPISANQLGALMCFGAMGPAAGPFGPAGMSPAMIVDNILRNQHLFTRSSNTSSVATAAGVGGAISQPPQPPVSKSNNTTDRNNNNNSPKQTATGKSKDVSNNSRYFSHYTEACPMCDRRFKSIKWLKTHMMNDHKQEIGAYMQMMMQYFYASKSQMAAAATMAALEQQQQQQQQQHSLAQHLNLKSHSQV